MWSTLLAALVFIGEDPAKQVTVPAEYGQPQGIVSDGKNHFLVTQWGVFPEKKQEEGVFDTKHPLPIIWGKVPEETVKTYEFDVITNSPESPKSLFIQVITKTTQYTKGQIAVAGVGQIVKGQIRFVPTFGAPDMGRISGWSLEKGRVRFDLENRRGFLVWSNGTQFLKGISPPDPKSALAQAIAKLEERIRKDPKNAESLTEYKKQLEEELKKKTEEK